MAKLRMVDGVAIVDHNTLSQAREIKELQKKYDDFLFIVGSEINTAEGELIGLGITEEIPPKLPLLETYDRIIEQGGTVIVPHPFEIYRKGIGEGGLDLLRDKHIVVEGLNGRPFFKKNNIFAQKYAHKYKLPMSAGSDAHLIKEVGRVYTQMDCDLTYDSVIKTLLSGEVALVGTESNKSVHILTLWRNFWHFIFGGS